MPKSNTTREVPVTDVLDLVNKSLEAILRKRAEIRDRQIARQIERANKGFFRRLFRLKPWDLERGNDWFENCSDGFATRAQDLKWTFGAAEDRFNQLKALCETFQTKEFIAISADDAELLSNWANC